VVNLETVRSVLEIVSALYRLRRQLPRLAHGRESGAQPIGDHRSENEPAALDADDQLDSVVFERQHHAVDCRAETDRILEQRGDVVEENPGLGEVGNAPDFVLQLVHGCVSHLTLKPELRSPGGSSNTSTLSTRAPRGPCRMARSKRSTASASPSAATSTR